MRTAPIGSYVGVLVPGWWSCLGRSQRSETSSPRRRCVSGDGLVLMDEDVIDLLPVAPEPSLSTCHHAPCHDGHGHSPPEL